MKVVLITGPKQVEMVEWDMPTLRSDEVLVRSRMVSLGSHDADYYKGNMQAEQAFPFVPGCAWVGEVAKVGQDVPSQLAGKRVVFVQSDSGELATSMTAGLAEYVAVVPMLLREIPTTMPFEDAVMLSSVAEIAHAFQRSATHALPYASSIEHASHIIAIVGDDATGLLAVQVAHALYPASWLVMIGFREQRLQLGKSMGATHTINIGREDALGLVRALSRGKGADITFEGTGDAQAAVEAMLLARRGGSVLLMGNAGANALFSVEGDIFVRNNLIIYGCSGTDSKSWIIAEQLYTTKQLNLAALISHRFTLDEYQDAFDELVGGQGRALCVLVTV